MSAAFQVVQFDRLASAGLLDGLAIIHYPSALACRYDHISIIIVRSRSFEICLMEVEHIGCCLIYERILSAAIGEDVDRRGTIAFVVLFYVERKDLHSVEERRVLGLHVCRVTGWIFRVLLIPFRSDDSMKELVAV